MDPLTGGALLAGGSLLGGLFADKPDDISVSMPEPSPIEKQISKMQLDVAEQLSDKINDPQIMRDIYSQLPETQMSQADRMRFTQQFSKIEGQIAEMSIREGGRAMGMNIDRMVEKGQISEDSGNQMRRRNEAAINATTKIALKKMEASGIAMARGQYLKDAQSGLRTAGTIADVHNRNKQIYNSAITQGLNNLNRRQGFGLNLSSQVAGANTKNELFKTGTMQDFTQGSIMTGMKGYMDYQANNPGTAYEPYEYTGGYDYKPHRPDDRH